VPLLHISCYHTATAPRSRATGPPRTRARGYGQALSRAPSSADAATWASQNFDFVVDIVPGERAPEVEQRETPWAGPSDRPGARRVVRGGGPSTTVLVSPSQRETAAGRWRPLSERERDIVRLVVEGRSNDEIGRELGIARKTVETHLARLYERYGCRSRAELAVRAEREGWLDLPPG
jgi:DNA-binding CsgD family transcriptional regulator